MPWLLIRRATALFLDSVLLFLVLMPAGQLLRLAVGWPSASPTMIEVWFVAVLNFSVPSWIYFIVSDSSPRGATVGKRLLGLHVARVAGQPIGAARALARTAVKLVPWETAHATFPLDAYPIGQWVSMILANGLMVLYLAIAALSRGRRSVHDYVAGTEVRLVSDGIAAPDATGQPNYSP
jgi:uncharacterized RDD family membrane protein YckC